MKIEWLIGGLLFGLLIGWITAKWQRYKHEQEWRRQECEAERANILLRTKLQHDAGMNVTGWPVTSDYDREIVRKYRIGLVE